MIPAHPPSPRVRCSDRRRGARRLGALCPALLVLFSASGAAPADGDPRAGQRLARQVCAECHAVEPDEVALIGPRSFLEVAMDPHTTEPGLRLFLRSPHVLMPNFILTEEQIGDVVAYILSLEVNETAE